MLISNTNYHLLEKISLSHYDVVIFEYNEKEYPYIVNRRWMHNEFKGSETDIIKDLINDNIISRSIRDFCEFYYGYSCPLLPETAWPEFKTNDYKAITRLVFAIFQLIDNANYNCKKLELTNINISFL